MDHDSRRGEKRHRSNRKVLAGLGRPGRANTPRGWPRRFPLVRPRPMSEAFGKRYFGTARNGLEIRRIQGREARRERGRPEKKVDVNMEITRA